MCPLHRTSGLCLLGRAWVNAGQMALIGGKAPDRLVRGALYFLFRFLFEMGHEEK